MSVAVRTGSRPAPILAVAGWLFLALAVAACVVSIAATTQSGVPFADWQTYSNAYDRFASGGSLYSPAQLAGPYEMPLTVKTGYSYPPPSIILLAPFVQGVAGLVAWMTLNLVLLISGLVAVLRRELGGSAPWPLAIVLFGLAVIPPFRIGVVDGNVNVALAGLLAWIWADDRWRRGTPVAAAFAAIIKVFPFLLVGWRARDEGLRAIVLGGAVLLALVIVTLLLMGVTSWVDYAQAMSNAVPACETRFPSIACVLTPFVGIPLAKLAGIVVGLALALAAIRVRSRLLAFVLLAAAIVAPVTDLHPHYGLFLFVVIVVVVAHAVGRRRPREGFAA